MTTDDPRPKGFRGRPRRILMAGGHDGRPTRRDVLRRRVTYAIVALLLIVVVFELAAILISRR